MTTALRHYEADASSGYPQGHPSLHPSHDADNTLVDASVFCGSFSLIDDSPMNITSVPGMTLSVNKGTLWVRGTGEGEQAYFQAGERYVSDQVGVLTLISARRTELRIALP